MSGEILFLLLPFVITQLIEWPLFSLFARMPLRRTFLFMLLVNLCTWPLACILYWKYPTWLPLTETGIAVTESLLIFLWWRWNILRSLAAGFLINGLSYGVGLIIEYFFFAA